MRKTRTSLAPTWPAALAGLRRWYARRSERLHVLALPLLALAPDDFIGPIAILGALGQFSAGAWVAVAHFAYVLLWFAVTTLFQPALLAWCNAE
jgi:hypothetical protein